MDPCLDVLNQSIPDLASGEIIDSLTGQWNLQYE